MSNSPRPNILSTVVLPALALLPSVAFAGLALSSVTAERPEPELLGEWAETPALVMLCIGGYVGGWAVVGWCRARAGRHWHHNCGRGTVVRRPERCEAGVEVTVRRRKLRRQQAEEEVVRDTTRSLFAGFVTLVMFTVTMWGC